MRDYISEHSAELLRRQQKRKRWYRLLCVCACIVVFCTTYALILPAITLDQTVSPGGSVTISVGDTVTLQGSSGNRNNWSDSPSGCVTIEKSGTSNAVVTGTAAGTVTVTHTYTNKGVSETFTITVEAADDENTEITASPDDSNYTVTVKGNKGVLTDGVTLHVEDYGESKEDYSAYYNALVADLKKAGASSINNEIDFAFLHMYHIYLTKEGVDGEYVPAGNVNLQVTITYTTAPDGWSKVNWVGHYKKNGNTVSGAEISDGSAANSTGVKQIKVSGNSITFHIQSFSVFPVAALAADTGDEGGDSGDSGTTTDSSILTADLLSGTKNAWQIVDGKYERNDSGDYKQVSNDGTVRVQKNVIPTDVENEFLVYLSIDTKQLFADYFASAEYMARTPNSLHASLLGTVMPIEAESQGSEVLVTGDSSKGYGKKATFTILSSDREILAEDITLYWSKGNNVTMFLSINGDMEHCILVGVKVEANSNNAIMLSKEAEQLIMSSMAQMAELNKVTDVMGDYIEYLGVEAGNYETEPIYDAADKTLTWTPKVKSNPTIDRVRSDESKTVTWTDHEGTVRTETVYSYTSWALNTAELVYKVRLNVTKDGFNSAANKMNSEVGDSESYPVNESATLTYGDNSTVKFQQPYVRGLLYDLKFNKVDKEDTGKKLSGASFTVEDKNGNSYTVSEVADSPGTYRAENLPAGTYTLTEETAPKGYQKGETSSWQISLSYTDDRASVKQDEKNPTNNMIPVSGTGSTDLRITNEKIKSVYVDLVKTDMSGNPLSGAVFSIYSVDPTIEGATPMTGYANITVDEDGVIADNLELENGTYYLVEKKAPDGYVLPGSNITLTVDTMNGTIPVAVSGGDSAMTAVPETQTINDEEATVYVIKIENNPGVLLPATGGSGTWFYTFGGLGLILLSGLMYGYSLRRKRKGGSCDL